MSRNFRTALFALLALSAPGALLHAAEPSATAATGAALVTASTPMPVMSPAFDEPDADTRHYNDALERAMKQDSQARALRRLRDIVSPTLNLGP